MRSNVSGVRSEYAVVTALSTTSRRFSRGNGDSYRASFARSGARPSRSRYISSGCSVPDMSTLAWIASKTPRESTLGSRIL